VRTRRRWSDGVRGEGDVVLRSAGLRHPWARCRLGVQQQAGRMVKDDRLWKPRTLSGQEQRRLW
jgi:hypothetical protein